MIEQPDDGVLLQLLRRTEPLGVLSVYVNVEPIANGEVTVIDIKNRYRELQRRVKEGAKDNSRDVVAALERLSAEVEQLTSPTEPGRGRVAFAALSGSWISRMATQMPVPNRVVLDDGPFIHPLLELLDEGRPAGIVLVSGENCRLLEWRLGRLEVLGEQMIEEVEAPHERAGQIGGGPPGQFHTPMLEHRQARERDRAQRFLNQVAQTVAQMAVDRGWERILASGGERWTDVLAEMLPSTLQEAVIRDRRVLAGLREEDLRRAVTDRLHDDHLMREGRLAEQVRDAGLSRAAALGLSEVTAALNEGRVAHLIYDPAVRYWGSVGADETLHAGAEIGVGGERGRPEKRLTERLVERALATAARVTPVEGAADGALSEATGIAAFLRW